MHFIFYGLLYTSKKYIEYNSAMCIIFFIIYYIIVYYILIYNRMFHEIYLNIFYFRKSRFMGKLNKVYHYITTSCFPAIWSFVKYWKRRNYWFEFDFQIYFKIKYFRNFVCMEKHVNHKVDSLIYTKNVFLSVSSQIPKYNQIISIIYIK